MGGGLSRRRPAAPPQGPNAYLPSQLTHTVSIASVAQSHTSEVGFLYLSFKLSAYDRDRQTISRQAFISSLHQLNIRTILIKVSRIQ